MELFLVCFGQAIAIFQSQTGTHDRSILMIKSTERVDSKKKSYKNVLLNVGDHMVNKTMGLATEKYFVSCIF